MSPERLAEIEARMNAATPGPWEWVSHFGDHHVLRAAEGTVGHSDGSAAGEYSPDIDVGGPDAALTDLLAYARALEAERDHWQQVAVQNGAAAGRLGVQALGLEKERDRLAAILRAAGFAPCSSAACNCGGWHGGHAEALRSRLRHVAQMLIDHVGAGGPMDAEAAAERAICALLEREVQRDEARTRLAAAHATLTTLGDAIGALPSEMIADHGRGAAAGLRARVAEVRALTAERDEARAEADHTLKQFTGLDTAGWDAEGAAHAEWMKAEDRGGGVVLCPSCGVGRFVDGRADVDLSPSPCLSCEMKALRARVAELEEAARWRPVSERPAQYEEVEIAIKGSRCHGYYSGDGNWLLGEGWDAVDADILGWRPIGPGPDLAVLPSSVCGNQWGGPFIDDGAADEALDGVWCEPESAAGVHVQVLHGGLDVWCAPCPK